MNRTMIRKPEERTAAEAFLCRAWDLHEQVTRNLEKLARLETIATRCTAHLQQDRVQISPRNDFLEQAVLEMDEVRLELKNHEEQEIEAALEIQHMIELVDHENMRKILDRRYLRYMKWADITKELSFNNSWIRRLHHQALVKVGSLLDQENRLA